MHTLDRRRFVGLAAGSNMDESRERHCGGAIGQADPNRCNAAGLDLRDDARAQADLATGLFVAGGALSVGGLTLLLVSHLTRRPAATRTGFVSAIAVGVSADRAIVSGVF